MIGYMAWVLATSVTVSKFVDGSMVSRSTDIHTQIDRALIRLKIRWAPKRMDRIEGT